MQLRNLNYTTDFKKQKENLIASSGKMRYIRKDNEIHILVYLKELIWQNALYFGFYIYL